MCWSNQRRRRIVLIESVSDMLPVQSGVPQESVLGPCLIIMFIKSLDTKLNSKIFKFAEL